MLHFFFAISKIYITFVSDKKTNSINLKISRIMIRAKHNEVELKELKALLKDLKKKISFDVELITPELAKKWIKRNTKNRASVGSPRVASYVRQMLDGVWGFSGQPIIFSDSGLLLDGGGRISAVIASNKPIICTVIYGVPESAFVIMDAIKARSFKDTIEASHLLDGETSTVIGYVASMTKRIMEWNCERYGSHGAATTRTVSNNIECLNFVENNLNQLRDCAKACSEMRGAKREKLISKKDYFGSFMGYLVITKGWDFSDAYRFFDELTNIHSEIRVEGHPITTLRMYLRQTYNKELHITDEQRFHMFSRAWNDYCKGKEIKRFDLKKSNEVPLSRFEIK